MAVLASFLLCVCVLGFSNVKATPDTLSARDSSFCVGGLEVIYPQLVVDKCLTVDPTLGELLGTVWNAPQIYFPRAHKLAELGSIAQAALREQRLDISLILIPSRVHSKDKMYTLVMVDPDAPSRAKPIFRHWRHWVVTNIQGRTLQTGQIHGKTLTEYNRPTPPKKSGFHRYQFRLFEQLPDVPVSLTKQENSSRGKWDLLAFIKRCRLGKPVATVQFLTKNYKG